MPRCSGAGLLACQALFLFQSVQPHMGTLFSIKLYTSSEARAKSAFEKAHARIAQLDAMLSDYRADSELNQLARQAGKPVHVSADLNAVLAASQRLAEETNGAFDITLGPVIRLWRQARRDHRLPDPAALREAAAHTGYRKLHLDPIHRTAMLDDPGMQLDLGAIAKGYAADAALGVLAELGIRRALVAASGDLAIGDAPPGRRGWKVGLDSPDEILTLANAAVSTSGDAEQHVEIDGRRYSHIIDPATLLGLTSPITVTVRARRGIDADSLATAISVVGAQRGLALIEGRPGVAARIVTDHVVESNGWRRRASR